MRIVSADIDGTRRFGRVDDEGVVHLFVTDRDPLDALDPDAPEIPTDGTVNFDELDVLEPPLPVTTVGDFITFEQHTAGSMQSMTDAGNDGEEVHAPDEWFRAPAFYFTNPYAATGSGHDVRVPPGMRALRRGARGRGGHLQGRLQPLRGGGLGPHRRFHRAQRLVRP
ncbi:MAG: hypothetical protein ACTH2Y_11565 [Corynebacterium sp.]|uniref:hypothetical protein n=1 Tax=Corynebacterium sp. TaxID=1720 RepID=UPI003F9345BB